MNIEESSIGFRFSFLTEWLHISRSNTGADSGKNLLMSAVLFLTGLQKKFCSALLSAVEMWQCTQKLQRRRGSNSCHSLTIICHIPHFNLALCLSLECISVFCIVSLTFEFYVVDRGRRKQQECALCGVAFDNPLCKLRTTFWFVSEHNVKCWCQALKQEWSIHLYLISKCFHKIFMVSGQKSKLLLHGHFHKASWE